MNLHTIIKLYTLKSEIYQTIVNTLLGFRAIISRQDLKLGAIIFHNRTKHQRRLELFEYHFSYAGNRVRFLEEDQDLQLQMF